MDRRNVLKGMAGIAAASAAPGIAQTAAQAPTKQRNVLLLISDDQGLDLGCYGTAVKTPRLDRLARQGTLFRHAYAAVSSCSPSRAVINTGLYTHQNGMYGLQHDVHNQSLLPGIETLPSMLRRAGYATALVGKKHVGPNSAFPYEAELVPERGGVRDVRELAIAAASFIRSTNERPFFVTIAYSDPHRAAVDYGNDRAWPGVKPETYDPRRVQIPDHLPDLPAVRQDLAEYYESLSRLDAGVGLILDDLAATGRADDTLVIFLSDNGRPFPGAKTNLYDAGLHLPLIIRAPGSAPGTSDAMVSFTDVVPTVLDWAGVAAPAAYPLSGSTLLPILGGVADPARDAIVASHDFHEINQYYPMRSIRTRTHNYILNLVLRPGLAAEQRDGHGGYEAGPDGGQPEALRTPKATVLQLLLVRDLDQKRRAEALRHGLQSGLALPPGQSAPTPSSRDVRHHDRRGRRVMARRVIVRGHQSSALYRSKMVCARSSVAVTAAFFASSTFGLAMSQLAGAK